MHSVDKSLRSDIHPHLPLILFLIILVLTVDQTRTFAQIYISGEIEGTLVDTTYIVEDDVVINRSLTIEPGACLQFMAGVQFDVNGALHAMGTEEDSIYFKSLNEGEHWGGIDINDTYFADIAWCDISGSSSAGILVTIFADPNIHNSSIHHNDVGVYYGTAWENEIYECSFIGNSDRGVFMSDDTGGVTIRDCQFLENGGGLQLEAPTEVRNCTFIGNHAENGGAIFINSFVTIDRCLFANNSATNGGAIYRNSTPELITNCTIVNNEAVRGGAIYVSSSLSNNYPITSTIFAFNRGNGAIYVGSFHNSDLLEYCCFFGNEGGAFYVQAPWEHRFGILSTTNANGDSCDFKQNIYLNPRFQNLIEYTLSQNSPCIDAGDPDLPSDLDGSISDIGVYPYVDNGEVYPDPPPALPQEEVSIYPNPCNNSAVIQLPQLRAKVVKLFDLAGREIVSAFNWNLQQKEITLDFSGTSSGHYIVAVHFENGLNTTKQVVVIH
ncbi:right-handed parallel beta-helix repeat-containing protein [bacterium]|nr:right-handed parallel beta-helix repeat-containing protein [bacterium]